MKPFRNEQLDNGLRVEFFDLSNRYFGDYHRVCVEVRMQMPSAAGDSPLVRKHTLERMGVAGGEVEAVRDRLTDDYWRHAGRYLALAACPERLLAAATSPRRRLGT